MKLLSPALWLRQAKADKTASTTTKHLAECHRRYLLQQGYEKGIKALAIACMSRRDFNDRQLASALGSAFLHHHTPMTVFSEKDDVEWSAELQAAYGATWQQLWKRLKTLRKEIARRLEDGSDKRIVDAWKQIDATRPSRAIDEPSYRYPFADAAHVDGIAPCAWLGWDAYQGTEGLVREAVDELHKRAGQQVAIWERG